MSKKKDGKYSYKYNFKTIEKLYERFSFVLETKKYNTVGVASFPDTESEKDEMIDKIIPYAKKNKFDIDIAYKSENEGVIKIRTRVGKYNHASAEYYYYKTGKPFSEYYQIVYDMTFKFSGRKENHILSIFYTPKLML